MPAFTFSSSAQPTFPQSGMCHDPRLQFEYLPSISTHIRVFDYLADIGREYLDRTFYRNGVDLQRKLDAFRNYYNKHRVHLSLNGITPAQCAGTPSPSCTKLASYLWKQHCRGLFQTPVPA